MRLFSLLFITVFALGCSSTVSKKLVSTNRQPLPNGIKMFVLNEFDPEPLDAVFIGEIKIGDSGFTINCDYKTVVEHAKTAARNAGANIIKITEIIKPNFLESTCYQLKAKIYSSDSEESTAKLQAKMNRLNESSLPANADYATVHFYMPRNTESMFPTSKIEIQIDNDSIISGLKIGGKIEYQTKNFGLKIFHVDAKTPPLVLNVEKGKEYFIRAGFTDTEMVGYPKLTLIENRIGMKEYREMN